MLPAEAVRTRWILSMCDRFGCLPSALLNEDSELMHMLEIEALITEGGE